MKAGKIFLIITISILTLGLGYIALKASQSQKTAKASGQKLTFGQAFKSAFSSLFTSKLKTGLTGLVTQSKQALSSRVPTITFPESTYWNKIRTELIPDFTIPTSYDPVMKRQMPNGGIIWHNVGRNMFNGVSGMLKKGIIAVNQNIPVPTDYPILPENLVVEAALGLGGVGIDDTPQNAYNVTRANVLGSCAGVQLQPDANGEYDPFLVLTDYEGTHTIGTSQVDTDIMQSMNQGQKSATKNYSSLMYLNPISGAGANIYRDMESKKSLSWFQTASSNAVPSAVGKSFQGDPESAAVLELSYYYETMLPEGKVVKDQNGNDWFTVSHFGSEFSTSDTLNKTANTQNWAAVVGGSVMEAHKDTSQSNQLLIAQLKDTCQVADCYYFTPNVAPFVGGKYIQEYNRYGVLQDFGNGNHQLVPTGTETVTPFIAEGQVLLAHFCGAKYINNWGSGFLQDLTPTLKTSSPRRGAKFNDFAWGNMDFEAMERMILAEKRLSEKCTAGGKTSSFYDIIDGNHTYLKERTKGSWDGGATFRSYEPIDWQVDKKSPMVAVVNNAKRIGFVLAFQSYGVEQDKLTFVYDENGANVKFDIDIPKDELVIEMFTF